MIQNDNKWNDDLNHYRSSYTGTDSQADLKKEYRRGLRRGLLGMGVVTIIVVVVLGGLLIAGGKGESVAEKNGDGILSADNQQKIHELAEYIETYYYEDVNEEDLVNGLYKGLFEGLNDPYSTYYTEEEYKDLYETSISGNYCGIGAGLQQNQETMEVVVTKVYRNSPAEEAGIQVGDVITYVDDIDATSMELEQLVQNIRGEENTNVHLQIYREGETDYLEFDLTRRFLDIETVEYKMLEDGIGYIYITDFTGETAQQYEEAYAELIAQGMKSMIVDLRYNGGGMLSAVCQILDDILPEGRLVYTEYNDGSEEEYTSDADCIDIPMAVLVNEYSASASEIFAGAIRDYEYGTLIGTTTFGKGIVQTIQQLEDGSAVKLTVAKYYTPNGDYIHGKGIDPDIELEYEFLGTEEDEYDIMLDNQILKAVEILKGETD